MNIENVRSLHACLNTAFSYLKEARDLITQASPSELDEATAKTLKVIEYNTNGAMDEMMGLRRNLHAREEAWVKKVQSMEI